MILIPWKETMRGIRCFNRELKVKYTSHVHNRDLFSGIDQLVATCGLKAAAKPPHPMRRRRSVTHHAGRQGSNFWDHLDHCLGGIVCRHPNSTHSTPHSCSASPFASALHLYEHISAFSLLHFSPLSLIRPVLRRSRQHGVYIQPSAALPAAADQDVYRYEEFL